MFNLYSNVFKLTVLYQNMYTDMFIFETISPLYNVLSLFLFQMLIIIWTSSFVVFATCVNFIHECIPPLFLLLNRNGPLEYNSLLLANVVRIFPPIAGGDEA